MTNMTKKIFRSIVLVTMTVLVGGLLIATAFLYTYFQDAETSQLKDELTLAAAAVETIGDDYLDTIDTASFRFTLIDTDGTVLCDTQADETAMDNHRDREEVREAFDSGYGSSKRPSATLTEKTIYEAKRLSDGTVLRVSVNQLTIGALLVRLLPAVGLIVIAAIVAAMLLSRRMAKRITAPLNQLDLDHPTEIATYEELSPILTQINKQHKQIKKHVKTLRQKSDEFEQIVSAMNEGLILIDNNKTVLSMNVAAMRIFSVNEDHIGQDVLTIDRDPALTKAIDKALDGKDREFDISKNGKEYHFRVSRIESDGKTLGAVILGFDITEKTFAERNRREFTANVSHELKTPLQGIIGSAELLESGLVKPEDTPRFVGNIKKEATRLVSLINDIIRLSQLDENSEPVTETVDLYEVAKEVVASLTSTAEQRHIHLTAEGETAPLLGVRRYMYEILFNLCDNALRYTHKGGRVAVAVVTENGHPVITVADTGIGIAPEHHERIFERFYRVDKSHSRETGGTGLGLSIVKHAVQFHGGKIHVDSSVGMGTTITITFEEKKEKVRHIILPNLLFSVVIP